MEEAPTPNSFKENKNNNKKDDSESFDLYSQNSDGLFQIVITNYNDYIEINCLDITDESNNHKKYSNKFNSKSLKEIMREDNINKAYQILKDIPPQDALIKEKDNIIILSIKSSFIKKDFLLYEVIDINDSLVLINQLRNENNNLKNRLDELEKKFETMNLNCIYNLFDVDVHKLENIFQQLTKSNDIPFNSHKTLINEKAELGLINKGIKHIFNKNISFMKMIYCSKLDGDAPDNFKKNYNENLIYSVIIISTKVKPPKKFGIFCNNQKIVSLSNQILNMPFNYINTVNYKRSNLFQQNMMNNNIINNQNQVNNQAQFNNQNPFNEQYNMMMNNNDIIIFNSNSLSNNYFVFSLDDFSIYYSNECNYFPNIIIKYNKQFNCLFGNENYIMNNNDNMNNNNTSNFKLSGNNQFNIDEYELYAINI